MKITFSAFWVLSQQSLSPQNLKDYIFHLAKESLIFPLVEFRSEKYYIFIHFFLFSCII